jgi:hypothetical protein
MRRWCGRAAFLMVVIAMAACSDAVAPPPRVSVRVAFLDDLARLNTVTAGERPEVTPFENVLPFAATKGAIYFLDPSVDNSANASGPLSPGGLLRYEPATGQLDTFPLPYFQPTSPGAVSPDGSLLVYTSVYLDSVRIHRYFLKTGQHDSLNLSGTAQSPAADQVLAATPVFNARGDSVVFLLPNFLGMQMLVFEPLTLRYDLELLRVPVIGAFDLISGGWPRWTARDGAVRFLVRLRSSALVSTDTVAVATIFPQTPERPAEIAFRAVMPDSVSLSSADFYSFSDDGNTASFRAVTTKGRIGLFALRDRRMTIETLLYQATISPRYPLVVP